jgi:hypothetical protein
MKNNYRLIIAKISKLSQGSDLLPKGIPDIPLSPSHAHLPLLHIAFYISPIIFSRDFVRVADTRVPDVAARGHKM